MAPALYGSNERRYYWREKHINNTKRSQASSNSYMTDFCSSNFHALETIGELDANAQRTAKCQGSETSLAGSGIGCNSISISNYTRAERKQIKTWLYSELERVHDLMSRLEARELDLRECRQMPELDSCGSSSKSVCEALPIPGAISQNEGRLLFNPKHVNSELFSEAKKRTLKANQSYCNADFELDFDREQNPKSRRGVKRSLQLKGDTLATKWQRVDIKAKKTADLMRRCGTILRKLMSHEFSWPFNQPVDVVKLNLPDYRQIITKPMDLGTIESKLHDKLYSSPLEFAEDVRLTFANAMRYNPKEQDAHIMAAVLCKLFERSWRPFSKKLEQLIVDCDNHQGEVVTEDMLPSPPTVLPHAAVTVQSHKEPNSRTDHLSDRQMTHEEKQAVAKMLEDVEPDQVDRVIKICRRKNPNLKPEDGEVTLDIDSLDSQSLWEIYSLLRGSKKSAKKQTPKQPHCGEVSEGDFEEEDVDIGIDIPTSSFPPVVIDRDDSVTSKQSSSSSSGDSGSSSSGSDSDSSSESEADADDAQSPVLVNETSPEKEAESAHPCGLLYPPLLQEPMGSGDEQRASPPVTTDGAKRPSSNIDQEASLTRGDATGATQEGGVTVPERQLLPQRLDRASLLKHRFADTILKAREKTLPLKNAGADPEKLRREKEELERLQREKKARLHTEAKLAEEVRRKAEAAAAVKARCQREAERQAARQALEQVEKTVGQSENFDLLKDLEMLGRASLGHPSVFRSAEDASNCARLQEHPLEQLGLFMKVDDGHFF